MKITEDDFVWLKIKSNCPSCKKEIGLWKFQDVVEFHSQDEENLVCTCPYCKKSIPLNSFFCMS